MTDQITPPETPAGDVAAALDAARDNVTVLVGDTPGAAPYAVRDDVKVEINDYERYQDRPVRPRGTVKALTADGFVNAFTRRTSDTTPATIYADIDNTRLVAVLNDDQDDRAGWRDHRITYQPQLTPEWKHWTGNQGLGTQDRFARAIEDGETEIRNPSATLMLDLAQTFTASVGAKFKKAGRLKDGRTQLTYEEDIEATAGEGMAEVPDSFVIEVRPFFGAEPVLVTCRLRYTLARGDLQIGYMIHRPEEIVRTSFVTDVVEQVRESLDGFPVIEGVPADPTPAGR